MAPGRQSNSNFRTYVMSSASRQLLSIPFVFRKRDNSFATLRRWGLCATPRRQSPSRSPTCVTKRRDKTAWNACSWWTSKAEDVERLEHELRYAFMIRKSIRRDGNHDTSPEFISMPVHLRTNRDIMAWIAIHCGHTARRSSPRQI